MNLYQRIEQERLRITGEVERLENEIKADEEALKDVQEVYNKALFTENRGRIDQINSQINDLAIGIARRKAKVNVLKKEEDNPVIQEMITNELRKMISSLADTERNALEKIKKMERDYKKLMDGISEVNDLYKKAKQYRAFINRCNQQIKESNRKDLGLSNIGVDVIGPIPKQMRKFLIQEGDLFG